MAATSNPGPDGVVHTWVGSHDEVLVHADGSCAAAGEAPIDLNQPPISAAGRAEVLATLASLETTIAANEKNARQLAQAVDGLDAGASLAGVSKEQRGSLRKWMRQVRRFGDEVDDFAQGVSSLNKAFHEMSKSIIQNVRA